MYIYYLECKYEYNIWHVPYGLISYIHKYFHSPRFFWGNIDGWIVCDFVAFKTLTKSGKEWVNHFVVTQNEAIFVYQNSLKHTLRPNKSDWMFVWYFLVSSEGRYTIVEMLLCFAENHYRFGFAYACKRDCTKNHTSFNGKEWGERFESLESAIVQ